MFYHDEQFAAHVQVKNPLFNDYFFGVNNVRVCTITYL